MVRMLLFLFLSITAFGAQKPLDLIAPFSSLSVNEPFEAPRLGRPVIILDPGHGGTDEGAKVQSFREKNITLRTCHFIKRSLEESGYKVIMTRSRDISLPLTQRVAIANRRRPALFISVHFNSSKNPTAKGIEVFYYDSKERERTNNSKKLADCILVQMIDQTSAHFRGVKKGNFQVIRETRIPAILVEAGFMTNSDERKLLKKTDYLKKLAKGIALGVEKYLKS